MASLGNTCAASITSLLFRCFHVVKAECEPSCVSRVFCALHWHASGCEFDVKADSIISRHYFVDFSSSVPHVHHVHQV